jgi:hypothetical protein
MQNDGMNLETRKVWRLLVASWFFFTLLAILNAVSVSSAWYCR